MDSCRLFEFKHHKTRRSFWSCARLWICEAEALSLALEVKAEAVLIDEAAGREMATRLGLSPVGVLGILLKAKARGSVTEIRPLLDSLRRELNFFISPDLYTGVLRLAREIPA